MLAIWPRSELLDTILSTPLDSVTRLPMRVGNFGNQKAFMAVLGYFSLRMHRIGIIYASGPKPAITVVLTDITFLQMDENVGDLTFQIIFRHIFTAHAQKQLLSFQLQLLFLHCI